MPRYARKGSRVSVREEKRMYKLWLELGSYAAVAKRTGRSPATVSAHVTKIAAYQIGKREELH